MQIEDYNNQLDEDQRFLNAIEKARQGNIEALHHLKCYPDILLKDSSISSSISEDKDNLLEMLLIFSQRSTEAVFALSKIFKYGIIVDKDEHLSEIFAKRASDIEKEYGPNFYWDYETVPHPFSPFYFSLGQEGDNESIRSWLYANCLKDSTIGIIATKTIISLIYRGLSNRSRIEDEKFIISAANKGIKMALEQLGCIPEVPTTEAECKILKARLIDVKALLKFYKSQPRTRKHRKVLANFYRYGIGGVERDEALARLIWSLPLVEDEVDVSKQPKNEDEMPF